MNPDTIVVPSANPASIDGAMAPGEWDGAAVEAFADGSELLLMQADGYLYLGIRANTPGIIAANIFVERGDEVLILHASAALGTAIYHKGVESWQQVQDFTWRCRQTSHSEAAQAERDAFLQQEGWVAANSRMGTPEELEYRIKITQDMLRLAVSVIPAADPDVRIPWPASLQDDCIRPNPGGLPKDLYLLPEQWAVLDLSQ